MRSKNKHFIILFILLNIFLVFFLESCTSKEKILIEDNVSQQYKIYENIKFKKNSLPSFETFIEKKEIKKFDKFNIIFFEGKKLKESYFLLRLLPYQKKYSLLRPFKIIYKWTKKGAIAGAKIGYESLSFIKVRDKYFALFLLSIPAVTTIVGFTGGLIKGIAKGVPSFGNEIGKIFSPRDYQIISYNKYLYDYQNRLNEIRVYSNENKILLMYKYFYKKRDKIPNSMKILNFIK